MYHQRSGFKRDNIKNVIKNQRSFAESIRKSLGKCIKDGFHVEGERDFFCMAIGQCDIACLAQSLIMWNDKRKV